MAGKNIGLVLQCQSLLYVTRWHASIPADKSYCDHSIIYQYNFTAQSSYVCHSYSHWVSKSLMSLPRHTFLEQSIYPQLSTKICKHVLLKTKFHLQLYFLEQPLHGKWDEYQAWTGTTLLDEAFEVEELLFGDLFKVSVSKV